MEEEWRKRFEIIIFLFFQAWGLWRSIAEIQYVFFNSKHAAAMLFIIKDSIIEIEHVTKNFQVIM